MGRLFGTDGVRGLANQDITAEFAVALAEAAARVLVHDLPGKSLRNVAIGRDTRASGEFLEYAVASGLAGAGLNVDVLGVVPTPAIAWLCARGDADFGVMISASHNPMPDNGIKFFGPGGEKLPDSVEDRIAALVAAPGSWNRPTGHDVGRIRHLPTARDEYVDALVANVPNSLSGISVVVDCANGAASSVAPEVLERAGARVIAIHAEPTGWNINENCGSTHMHVVAEAVRAHGADAGIAHDGDADRCLAVAADGTVVDGDHILGILATSFREANRLVSDTVVTTVMANLGFRQAMEAAGIHVWETAVGDRYVLEAMRSEGFVLGGEQSGHVVLSDYATTGDGVLTALHLLARMTATGRSMAELAAVVPKFPQVLVNVSGVDKSQLASNVHIETALRETETQLGGHGRVLLRPSGTEPLVRVMVEAATENQAHDLAQALARVIQGELGPAVE